jgi:tRNA (cytosine34-C5)-methyltransferase
MENEAVVAEILRMAHGSLELVEASDMLPGLLRRPGMSNWKVMSKDGSWYDSFAQVPNDKRDSFKDSMFPAEDCAAMGLEKCLRIYPHLQNTGGFFVAVLQKTGSIGKADTILAAESLAEASAIPAASGG